MSLLFLEHGMKRPPAQTRIPGASGTIYFLDQVLPGCDPPHNPGVLIARGSVYTDDPLDGDTLLIEIPVIFSTTDLAHSYRSLPVFITTGSRIIWEACYLSEGDPGSAMGWANDLGLHLGCMVAAA